MQIIATKTGKFGHPELGNGYVELVKGETVEVDGVMAASIIDCKWGGLVPKVSEKPKKRATRVKR